MNYKFTKETFVIILLSGILFGLIGFFAGKYFQRQEMFKNFQNRQERQGSMNQGNNGQYRQNRLNNSNNTNNPGN